MRQAKKIIARYGFSVCVLLVTVIYVFNAMDSLEILRYNFDEGVYIQQAKLVAKGQAPYRDFFYHQPPLYLYLLAIISKISNTLIGFRLVSVVATALTGLVVFAMARSLAGAIPGVFALVLFLFAPIEHYGKLALPNACMLFFATMGVYLLCFCEQKRWTIVGAMCLLLSLLVKPLSLPFALTTLVVLSVYGSQRWKVPAFVVTMAVGGVVAFLILDVHSQGAFHSMVWLQIRRFATASGLEIMKSFGDFTHVMAERGVSTALEWNLKEHELIFWSSEDFKWTNRFLAGACLAGMAISVRRLWGGFGHRVALLHLNLWAALLFSLMVWEPVWDHYFIQYLPWAAVLTALLVGPFWRRSRLYFPLQVVLCGLLVTYVQISENGVVTEPEKFEEYKALAGKFNGVLAFDPMVNVVSGVKPACGLIDPINVFGPTSLSSFFAGSEFAKFQITVKDLEICLDQNPDAVVFLGDWGLWFLNIEFREYLNQLPQARVIHSSEVYPLHLR